ncbi:MAG: SRPBCC family protein [Bacteroidota bacterium]
MTGSLLVCLSLLLLVGCAARVPEADTPVAEGTNHAFSHTLVTTASPDEVWRLWTDPDTWPAWDTELDSASLDGPWREGARGRLQPLSGPSSSFSVTAVSERETAFSTRFPLGALRVVRRWEPVSDTQIAITHEVSFVGFSGRIFASRFGPRFRAALPQVMARLDSLARADSAP